jgi:hypothetical protein
MTDSHLATRRDFLAALRRAEALAAEIAKTACASAVSGRGADLEAARMALEAHRRAKEMREQTEADLARLEAGRPE